MEEFLETHEPQLKSINFPPSLYDNLYQRLQNLTNEEKIVDNAFEIRKLSNSARSMLISKKSHDINETFYLIDHVWKNDGGKTAYERLEKTPQLTEKLATMFNIPPPVEAITSFDFSHEIDLIASMSDTSKNDVEKQLKESDYDTIATLASLLDKDDYPESEAPIEMEDRKKTKKKCSLEEFKRALQYSGHTSGNESDAYIQKMYDNFLLEAEGHGNTLHYNWSDDGSAVTVYVSIPTTTRKQAVTSMLTVNTWKLVVNGVQLVKGDLYASVKPDDSMWAIETPGVLSMTLEKVMGGNLWPELMRGEVPLSRDTIFSTSFLKANNVFLYLKEICDSMWTYNQTYSLMSQEGAKVPVWYVMDKYGCALTHGGADANFQCSPFFHITSGATFNLLWPIKRVEEGSMCTRNFIPHIMPQESISISKTRLKSFTGRKLYPNVEKKEDEEGNEEVDLNVNVEHIKQTTSENSTSVKSFSSPIYNGSITDEIYSDLKLTSTSDPSSADLSLLTLDEVSITLDGDVLPAVEIIKNKSFFLSYLRFQFEDHSWYQKNYILPRDLEDFCLEVERSDIPWIWCVKQVDKRQVDVPIVLSTQYSRIVRMCEVGPIAVSKFIKDQPQFRHRRFTLNYTVVLDKTRNAVFIHKEPLIHQSSNDYDANDILDEYDTSNDVIKHRHDALIGHQDTETLKDFKNAMNKLLLPRDENNGWDVYQDTILKRVGTLAKTMCTDAVVPQQEAHTCVAFGVDVIINSDLTPMIIDVNGVATPCSKNGFKDILQLIKGDLNENFVQVK